MRTFQSAAIASAAILMLAVFEWLAVHGIH